MDGRTDDGRTDGWNATLYIFQPYQDDERVIVKGCVQWNLVYDWKDFLLQRVTNPRPLDQQASA